MTRFLEKNKKYQVNSNLIGVQVRPDTWKVVDSIDVDITNNFMEVYPCVIYDDGAAAYIPAKSGNMPAFLANTMTEGSYDGGIEIYFLTGNSETDINGDKYNECMRYPDAGVTLYMNANDDPPVSLQTHLYDLDWDESQQGYVAVARTNGASIFNSMFNIEGEFAQRSAGEYIDVYGNIIFKEGNIEGVVGGESGEGFIVNEYSDTGTYTFDRTDVSVDQFGVTYYYWDGKGSGYPTYNGTDTGVGTLISWDDVKVGDQVIFNMYSPSYNPLSVKSVSDHQESDEVNCTVSYSVDGETWTDWSENMTDDNNVISDIPRYMYLKFGQDVEITEE